VLALLFTASSVLASPAAGQTRPTVGQEGKDVPWVPTPDVLVDKMLEMAEVSPADLVVDLGSGDGRTVVAAARLGARAIGIELDPQLVALSNERATEAGLADLTEFVAIDLFEYDLSQATVITLFLLPDINLRLRPTLFGLEPGTRIVSNTWDLSGSDEDPDAPGWTPDRIVVLDPCPSWCTSLLWVVPAKVAGTWRLGNRGLQRELQLEQRFQMVSGSLGAEDRRVQIEEGRLNGTVITFRIGETSYRGQVDQAQTTMRGVARTPDATMDWQATRVR
jgi:SAM-dependent methyltransferase